MKKTMLVLKKSAAGAEFYELSKEQGAVLAMKKREKTKSIAQQDFSFLLCAFVALLLEVNQILDQLIIHLMWYIQKQLSTLVLVKMVDIYLHFGEW